jgi:phytoene dehydrogenase-like protein
MDPFLERFTTLLSETLRPIRFPSHPLLMLRFGWKGLRSCDAIIRSHFRGKHAAALFAGCASHAILPLDAFATSSFGLMLALVGHAAGWPLARGGSSSIIEALAACLRAHGGTIETGREVTSLRELPESRAVLFDLTPRQVARVAGDALPSSFRRRYEAYSYGPGSFKVDWALAGPIPWRNVECTRAATVHVGPTYEEIMRSEAQMSSGVIPEQPFVLVAQQSLFDDTRAPAGHHTGWGYCHVPHGSTVDVSDKIEAQIERFAPGFRDLILERHIINPMDLQAHNPNMIGGDIGGGANNVAQFLLRPIPRMNPYTTPNDRLFLCSSSTPPGGGVHGMCGYWGANAAMKKALG